MSAKRLSFEGPVDPVLTLRRLLLFTRDPTSRVIGRACWIAFRTDGGPATVRYERSGERDVEVEAFGPGAERALEHAAAHLGADDEPEAFTTDHPLLSALAKKHRGLRIGRTGRLFERLLPVILAQKVTGAGAARSFRELVYRYGEQAPESPEGPKLWLQPPAERFRELAYHDFHPLGVERRRAQTILEVARRARRFSSLEKEDALQKLGAMQGIGPWTLGHVAAAVYGDADAVPVGDYHFPNMVAFALAGEPRADDARMLELLEPFRPHRGRVVALLMLGGPSPPRYGPRMPVRDIRDQ